MATSTSKTPRVIGLISIIIGLVFVIAGGVTWGMVSSQLAAENITVSEDAAAFGGQLVRDPFTAFAQADIINHHALDSTDGRTYAEIGAEMSALREQGVANDAEEMVALQQARTTVMNASFLRASLFTSVVAFGVAALVMGLGVAIGLIGLALTKVRAVDVTAEAAAPAATPQK